MILEKLFGDEDLNREHIQYVVNLLASQKTDEYLYGLNLDLFNFDLQECYYVKTKTFSFFEKE